MLIATALGNFNALAIRVRRLGLAVERDEGATRHEVGRDVLGEVCDQILEDRPRLDELATAFVLHREAVPRERIRRRLRDEATKSGDAVHKRGRDY